MRFGIFIFSLLYFSPSLMAQDVVITYERTANIENQTKQIKDEALRRSVAKDLAKPYYFTLLSMGNESVYKPAPEVTSNDKERELSMGSQDNVKIMTIGMADGGIYKNRETKEYLSEENLLGKRFLVKDTLLDFNWKILPDTKKIGKLECMKATTTYDGKEIVAWFAREIPIFDGPRLFQGLPGLIIELYTPSLNFKVISIKELKGKVELTKPSKGKPVSLQAYKKIQTERINALKQGRMFGN